MKKIGSFLLAMVCLMVFLPVIPAFAAVTTVYTEDFDGTFNSNVFNISNIFYEGGWNGTYSASEDGYNGGTTALNIKATDTAKDSVLLVKNLVDLGMTASSKAVFNTRIKFVGNSTQDTLYIKVDGNNSGYRLWYVKGGADGKYTMTDGQTVFATLNPDTWYDMSILLEAGMNENGQMFSTTYIYNSETGEDVGNGIAWMQANAQNQMLCFWMDNLPNGGIMLDDAKFYSLKDTDSFSYVEDGSTVANSEIAPNGEITVKFDQTVTPSASMFSVKKDGVLVEDAIESVKVKDFNTVVVKLKNLTTGSAYTLNFNGITSAGKTPITGTSSIPFNTPTVTTVYTEDFNGNFNSNQFYSSSIFLDDDGAWNGTYSASENGYNGGTTALNIKATESAKDSLLLIKPLKDLGMTASSKAVFNTRIKFVGNSTQDTLYIKAGADNGEYKIWYVYGGADGKYTMTVDGQTVFATLNPDTWYDMSILFEAGMDENEKMSSTTYIYNSETGEEIGNCVAEMWANAQNKRLIFWINNLPSGGIMLDDAKFYSFKGTGAISYVENGSTATNSEIAADGSITLAFDHPVTPSTTMFSVKKNGVLVENAVKSVKVKDFNKAIISFSGLDYLADYTLDYAEVKSAAGTELDSASQSEIAFKTGVDPYNELTMKGDAVCSNNAVTFSLHSKTGVNPTILVAIYNGDIIEGVEVFENAKSIAAGTTESITVTLKKAYTGNIAKIFAWEGLSTLKPLMLKKDITLN